MRFTTADLGCRGHNRRWYEALALAAGATPLEDEVPAGAVFEINASRAVGYARWEGINKFSSNLMTHESWSFEVPGLDSWGFALSHGIGLNSRLQYDGGCVERTGRKVFRLDTPQARGKELYYKGHPDHVSAEDRPPREPALPNWQWVYRPEEYYAWKQVPTCSECGKACENIDAVKLDGGHVCNDCVEAKADEWFGLAR